MPNGAYSFDGNNDGISYAHISTPDGANKLTVSLWLYPIGSTFYDYIIEQLGLTTGSGGTDGFAILNNSTDASALAIAARNASTSPFKATNTGVLTTNAWNHVHMVYDGTQGTATNRLRLWVNGSEIVSWASDTADFPTTLGTTDQPLALAYDTDRTSHANPPGDGAGYNQCQLSDVALFFGRAITDSTIAAMAGGMSAGNYVTTGDFWASFRVNQHDENGSRTGTLVDAPTLTTGPSLTYPGGGASGPFPHFTRRRLLGGIQALG